MRALHKLTQKGSSTQFTIPKMMLVHLGWLAGENMIIELLDDNSVRVRRPCERDFTPMGAPRMLSRAVAEGAK
jgi:hypothetical protein